MASNWVQGVGHIGTVRRVHVDSVVGGAAAVDPLALAPRCALPWLHTHVKAYNFIGNEGRSAYGDQWLCTPWLADSLLVRIFGGA